MNKKKLLALLMALVMTLTLVPVTALAEEPEASFHPTDDDWSDGSFADALAYKYNFESLDEDEGISIQLNRNITLSEDMSFPNDSGGEVTYYVSSGATDWEDDGDGTSTSIDVPVEINPGGHTITIPLGGTVWLEDVNHINGAEHNIELFSAPDGYKVRKATLAECYSVERADAATPAWTHIWDENMVDATYELLNAKPYQITAHLWLDGVEEDFFFPQTSKLEPNETIGHALNTLWVEIYEAFGDPRELANEDITVQVTDVVNYVAKIGETKYTTLQAAFGAAQDGDTITLLANCSGNGIKAPQGKFTTGLTVDFAGFTYTVDGETVGSTGTETNGFQLLKDNTITFKNGTITSAKAKILVQNYSNLTLQGMTLTLNNPNYAYGYTLSNNNGNVVIDDTTINANPAGGFAFDVCRYSSYPSVSVTVQGDSVINGNIEFDAGSGDPKNGISLALNGGTHDGAINLTNGGKTALDAGTNASITKASTFTQTAPEGYTWSAADTNGIQTLVKLPPVAQIGSEKYTSLQSAITAAQTGDTINIIADFAIPETNTAESDRIIVNKSVTIDFGEYTMSVPGALGDDTSNNWVGLYIQGNDVNVTLTGTTGGIDCLNYNDGAGAYSFYAKDGATVTVNGGHYHGGGTVGQVAAGTLIINDGYFKVTDYSGDYSGYRYVLNCIDSYYNSGTAKITVKGGTFESFDPSDCLAEGANTNFVADGYEAVALTDEDDGWYQVGKVKASGLTPQAGATETSATYKATKKVVDSTDPETVLATGTTFTVTVDAPTDNLAEGKEAVQLSNIDVDEVVSVAVDKASEEDRTSASVIVQLAKDESAQVVAVTETTKKVTFEVHPEAIITVEKTGEDSVVTTLPLTNDQIKGAFSFKLTIPTDLATEGKKVTVIHRHSDNKEENLGAFTVSSDQTITLTGISSFSEFIATSVSEDDVTVGAVGASLRRRVLSSDHNTVVNTSTDYRVTFDWTDTGHKVDINESYMEWSNNNGTTWHKVSIANTANMGNSVTRASVVITGIPSTAFSTTIKTRIHLATSGNAIEAYGPDYSVNVVADKLSKLTGNETWSEYGKFLLGTRTEPLYVGNN